MKRFIVLLNIAILALGVFAEARARSKSGSPSGILVLSTRLQNGNNWEI